MDSTRIAQTLKYMNILEQHGFFKKDSNGMDNILNNLVYTLESLEVIGNHLDPNRVDNQACFDNLKFLANLCMFEDSVMPICRRYNPTEKDKAKFLEWIKEHPVDDPQK